MRIVTSGGLITELSISSTVRGSVYRLKGNYYIRTEQGMVDLENGIYWAQGGFSSESRFTPVNAELVVKPNGL